MTDLLTGLGMLQSNGGLMVALLWLVWEMRKLRSDFHRHVHDDNGDMIIKVAR